MTAFSRVLFLCVSLGMSFDKVPAQRVQRNPSLEILNLVHLLPDQLRFTVSALCHGHLLRSFIPHLPHLTLFSWVHFETPLTEFKNLESWDGPFLYLHIQLGTTLSGKKILSYIEPDLSWDSIWQQAPTFSNMNMETPWLSCWGRTAHLLILRHSDHSFLVGLRCSPTQKPPHRWKMPSFLKITDCPASLRTSCFQAQTPLEEPVHALVTHHALLGV